VDLYHFNILSDDEKAQLVWGQGVFLTNRVEKELGINLYGLSGFYVEIWYNQESN
jgi:hypothetical protein